MRQFFGSLYCLNHKFTETCSSKNVLKILIEKSEKHNGTEVTRSRMLLGWKITQHILHGHSCCICKKPVQMATSKVDYPLNRKEGIKRKQSKHTCIFFTGMQVSAAHPAATPSSIFPQQSLTFIRGNCSKEIEWMEYRLE